MTALGIDYGEARIGVAVSDPLGVLARPLETVPARPGDRAIARLTKIAAERKVEVMVVGLPIRQDGTEGPAAENVRRFAETLKQALPRSVRLEFFDEFRSTTDAAQVLREAGRRPADHRQVIDMAAAAVILQGWLDAQVDDTETADEQG